MPSAPVAHSTTPEELRADIERIRRAVREHRDQVGDYRCWVDDEVLYARTIPELEPLRTPPPEKVFHSFCEHYFNCRQRPGEARPKYFPLDSSVEPLNLEYGPELDADLDSAAVPTLSAELELWRTLISDHHAKGQLGRKVDDDLALALALPEKKEPCTLLPPRERFLGRGCPSYNAHCQKYPEDFAQAVWKPD